MTRCSGSWFTRSGLKCLVCQQAQCDSTHPVKMLHHRWRHHSDHSERFHLLPPDLRVCPTKKAAVQAFVVSFKPMSACILCTYSAHSVLSFFCISSFCHTVYFGIPDSFHCLQPSPQSILTELGVSGSGMKSVFSRIIWGGHKAILSTVVAKKKQTNKNSHNTTFYMLIHQSTWEVLML